MKLNCFSFILFALLFKLGTTIETFETTNSAKIFHGTLVRNIEMFPFIFQLLYMKSCYCACSAISEKLILTAGHCLGSSANNYEVLAGKVTVNDGIQRIAVSDSYKHPLFDRETLEYDVAVLRLKEGLKFSEKVHKVSIKLDYQAEENTFVWTAGWGVYKFDSEVKPVYSSRLRYVRMRIYSISRCQDILGKIYEGFNATNRIYCAGNEQIRKSVAIGDYGGPLIIFQTNIQIGIMSWGSLQDLGVKDVPAVYTNVGNEEIYEFIQSIKE